MARAALSGDSDPRLERPGARDVLSFADTQLQDVPLRLHALDHQFISYTSVGPLHVNRCAGPARGHVNVGLKAKRGIMFTTARR